MEDYEQENIKRLVRGEDRLTRELHDQMRIKKRNINCIGLAALLAATTIGSIQVYDWTRPINDLVAPTIKEFHDDAKYELNEFVDWATGK